MRGRKKVYQRGGDGGDSGEDLLIDREQVRVTRLKRFEEGRRGVRIESDQILRGAVAFGGIRKLSDEPLCLSLFAAGQP